MKPYLKLYRFLCLLLAGSLACGAAYADAKSKTLLDALTTRMNGYNSYEVQFTVRMDQEFGDMPGRIVVSGNRYYVSVNGAEVFFDGKVRQTYNSRDNEVVIETPDLRTITFCRIRPVFSGFMIRISTTFIRERLLSAVKMPRWCG